MSIVYPDYIDKSPSKDNDNNNEYKYFL